LIDSKNNVVSRAKMKSSDIIEKGSNLLKKHGDLFKKLIHIPERRNMTFRIDTEENLNIGKPRFKNRYYLWPNDLLIELRDHLEDVWNFFDTYSHWIDDTIMPILTYHNRRESKRSVIYLLESDVWETREVFGDYLIEKKDQKTILNYYRFNKKFKIFQIPTINDLEIENWIKQDAIKQIKNQLEYLWSKIENEIKTSMEEKYHKEPRLLLNSDYLRMQLKKTQSIIEDWPEAALLNLGRIIEIWLLIQLDKENSEYGNDLLKEVETRGVITMGEFKFLSKVRRKYNDLKHKRFAKVKKEPIRAFISEFLKTFKI